MHNLLVVSDVHLCRLRPHMMEGGQRHFAGFIEHLAHAREGGLPWRLVANGDVLDFDHQAESMDARGPEDASLRLFAEIASAHESVFRAFARFLDAGHEIVVIPGNHDLDLIWPSVRAAFVAEVARHTSCPDSIERLSFRDWFHHEPGRVWIEHGHQQEPDGALVGMLDPFDDGPRLRRNLGAWWISDFCPHITEIAYHVDHTRGPLFYLPILVRRLGLKGPWLWLRYLWFALRTLRYAGGPRALPGPLHAARRSALAETSAIPEDTLRALEAAMPPPRIASKLSVAARLHALPAALLPIIVGLGIAALAMGSGTIGLAAAALLTIVVAINIGVSSRFHGSAVEHLVRGARRVQQIIGAPLVVMGHVHVATDVALGEGRYLNSGTWADPRTSLGYVRIVGHDAKLCEFTPAPAAERSRAAA